MGIAVSITLILALAGQANAANQFHTAYRAYPAPTGSYPHTLTADFNGDGVADVVISSWNTVLVYLTNVDGSLRRTWEMVGVRESAATGAGDVDNDGIADLVRVGYYFSITVYHGRGDGTFAPSDSTPASSSLPQLAASKVSVVDLNEDGHSDLVIVSASMSYLWVAFGNGDGSFSTPQPIGDVGAEFLGLAIADFDGDNHPDCAVVLGSGLAVLLNDGHGSFTHSRFTPFSSYYQDSVHGLVALDIDGDGDMDLATSGGHDTSYYSLWIFRNDGAAGFTPAGSLYVDQYQWVLGNDFLDVLTTGDIDGDGFTDIVVGAHYGGALFRGNGTSLEAALVFDMVGGYKDVAVLERGPGRLPILASTVTGRLSTYEWSGHSFDPTTFVPVDTIGDAMGVADFDHDGLTDVVVSVRTSSVRDSFALYRNEGPDGFERMTYGTAGNRVVQAEPVDINRDGLTDLLFLNTPACGCSAIGNISVLIAKSPWTFRPRRTFGVGAVPLAMTLGDWNDDGRLDVAVADKLDSGHVSILVGDGNGGFTPRAGIPLGFLPQSIVKTDLDEDGRDDLVAAGSSGAVALLRRDAATCDVRPLGIRVTELHAVATSDFDHDGHMDLAAAFSGNRVIRIFRGRGDGTVVTEPIAEYADLPLAQTWPSTIQLADLNGDGTSDLIVSGSTETGLLMGRGDGTFDREVYGIFGDWGTKVADFNADGIPDLISIIRRWPTVSGLGIAFHSHDVSTPIFAWLISAQGDRDGVTLHWEAPGLQSAAPVERRHGSEAWARVGEAVPVSGKLDFFDRDVRPGERYGYRLLLTIQGRSITTDEAWVQVPAQSIVMSISPKSNPVRGAIELAFTLPTSAPASVDVFDLAGRRVAHEMIASLTPGDHHLQLRSPLPPGLYMLRLAQGISVAHSKLCVLR